MGLVWGSMALLLVAIVAYSIFYLIAPYSALCQWYLGLGPCIYNSATWAMQFFTPVVKTRGNIACILALPVAVLLLIHTIYTWRRYRHTAFKVSLTPSLWPWYSVVVVMATVFGMVAWHSMPPAYDEIFSAAYSSGAHPFQALSYYMLPNNHILFNVVNGTLFGWYHHLVGTGRLLSLLAYVATGLVAYRWLMRATGHKVLALLGVIPILLQFAAWGMSTQARGYACQLLCGWLVFTVTASYLHRRRYRYILLLTITHVAGFALVPSWFYYFATYLLFVGVHALRQKHIRLQWLLHIAITMASTFLFYLPAICFSGIAALTGNRYVAARHTLTSFLPDFAQLNSHLMAWCYAFTAAEGSTASYLLFAAPLLLLAMPATRHYGYFFLCLWLGYVVCSMGIRHNPFHRTLIVQFSLSMALLVFLILSVAQWITRSLQKKAAKKTAQLLLAAIPISGLVWKQTDYFRTNLNIALYGNDVNGIYTRHLQDLHQLQEGSTIGCSPESFYFYFVAQKAGYNPTLCPSGTEPYYIKREEEPMPGNVQTNYRLLLHGGEDYEIYQRKP